MSKEYKVEWVRGGLAALAGNLQVTLTNYANGGWTVFQIIPQWTADGAVTAIVVFER